MPTLQQGTWVLLLGILLVTSGCQRSDAADLVEGCPPDLLAGPKVVQGTPFSSPPVLRDRRRALRSFYRQLEAGGLSEGDHLPPHEISSLINASGAVARVIIDPSVGEATDSAIARAARSMEYHPAYRGAEAVCVWITFAGATELPR